MNLNLEDYAMRGHLVVLSTMIFAGISLLGQSQAATETDQAAIVTFAQKAAVRAVNFHQGDAVSLTRARADFTREGWKDFMKHMEGYLDPKGAPAFDSSFVPSGDARVLDEKDGIVHIRIPGTLKQGNKVSSTTYRAALEVRAGGNPIKIDRLEQITCAGASTACQ
jgi:hypothetical protein